MATVLSDLASTIGTALSSLPPPDQIQDAERMQVLGAISRLQEALEPPAMAIQRMGLSTRDEQYYHISVIRIAQGMGIFDAFAESGGAEMTAQELYSKTKGDETLLKRVMRVLCAHRVYEATTAGTYRPLPPAMALASGSMPENFMKHMHTAMQVSAKLFEYFENRGYRSPEDAYDGPFQFAYGTSEHYFDWLKKHPEPQHAFNVTMTATEQDGADYWFDVYPVKETLTSPDPDRVLLVDIGGGVGHTLTALKRRFPDLSGKLILEDLPQVIDDIKEPLSDNISAIKYDMFEPQPIRGAKMYYMRRVLHDWPDKQALMALSRIREAMAEDSVLIIHDYTFPDGHDGPDVLPFAAIVDFQLMELMSSHERTQQQWVALLEKAGFREVKIYKGKSNAHPSALFEATL
ncbi:S-adenosyl-L-methionine-dependent methyltransferase [Aspergillus tetrazonus]